MVLHLDVLVMEQNRGAVRSQAARLVAAHSLVAKWVDAPLVQKVVALAEGLLDYLKMVV